MKVIALNGSPHRHGNTFDALTVISNELQAENIETEIINIGSRRISGCMGCGACQKTDKCVFSDEWFEEVTGKMLEADGLIFASPVYVGSINGTFKSFLDRITYAQISSKGFRHKVGAAIAIDQTAGALNTLNQLVDYFLAGDIITVPSSYWPIGKGSESGNVFNDNEFYVNTAKNLGRNMAWILKMQDATKDTIARPELIAD